MPHTMHSFEANPCNVPAFLIKLWKLVEDPACNDLIAWSDSGASFIIKDQTRFSKELLPQYFKHSNMASFIRQLNMYGFRKVMNYEKSGLRNENDEMEFQHSFFSKGQISLLAHIKRKIPNTKVSEPDVPSNNARDILTDLSSIREKQENMDNMLLKMKQENELLWRELTNMRKKHKAQEHVIQKVIQFLVSIVQRSNQNIGVQRKMARMLHDSSGNQGNSQVTCALDVLRNKNQNFIAMPPDKIVSPLGPVIHEVTDFEQEHEENSSPCVQSPEEKAETPASTTENENQEIECPMISMNSPINTSAMEPLSILERLETSKPDLNSEECTVEESVLGLPYDYISAPPSNVISLTEEEELCDNVISLPETSSNADESYNFNAADMLGYTTPSKSDFDDSFSESLQTPKIPTIHIEDPFSPKSKEKNSKEDKNSREESEKKLANEQQKNEHNYQLALSDPSNSLQSSTLTSEEKRCTNYISNSEIRLHASVPPLERRNTFSNHVLTTEQSLDLLQHHLTSSCNTWNMDTAKLLGLFSTDDGANNDILAEEVAGDPNIINIKTEPDDIVGNEIVQFTPSMLEVGLDMGNNQFFECLNQDAVVPSEDANKCGDQKFFLGDIPIQTDQEAAEAASEAAEFLLSNGSPTKQKSVRRPKIQKVQKAKKRKTK